MSDPDQPQKVKELGIRRQPGFVYFIDAEGDISRSARSDDRLDELKEKVLRVGLQREPGFLYFLDSAGDIARSREVPPQERPHNP